MAKSKKKPAKPANKSSVKPKKAPAKKVSKPAPKKAKPAAKKAKPAAKKISKPAKVSKPAAKKAVAKKPIIKKQPVKSVKHAAPIKKVSSKSTVAAKLPVPVTIKPKKGKEKHSKTRYSDNELEEFRQLILEKVEAAKKELKYLQDQISRSGDNTADDTENKYNAMDDGGNSMEREYLNQMAARQRMYLDHLDKALVRIQNKTYGICRVTGKLIEKERLRAVPHATLSMEAKIHQSHPQPINNV